jgi:hypothetical protein
MQKCWDLTQTQTNRLYTADALFLTVVFLCLIILRSVSLSFSHNIFDKQCEGLRVWMCDGNINNPSDLQTETFFQTFKRKFLLQAYLFYFSEDIFIHDLLIKWVSPNIFHMCEICEIPSSRQEKECSNSISCSLRKDWKHFWDIFMLII